MAYYLGLDNGGTVTKAAIFDSTGRSLALARVETEVQITGPGFAERDMEQMWQANCTVIRSALEQAKLSPEEIACVTCCGHGKGLYLWGTDNCPVRPGILSTDHRASDYPLQWKRNGTAEAVFRRTYQHILSSQPVALMAWLRDHEPESLEKTKWVFSCKDYIRFRLTGQARGEKTDFSGNNLLNLQTGEYDSDLLSLFGLSKYSGLLPPLCESSELCGVVTAEASRDTGLRPGTPVAGGAFDIDACALAVGITSEEDLCMIAGTWSINEFICRRPVLDGSVMMNSLFCIPGYYLVEECSPTGAGNLEWFIHTLLPELQQQEKEQRGSIYNQLNQWVQEIPETEFCPTFLPFLMGGNIREAASGALIGIKQSHTRAHIARSVYEGVIFSHKWHFDRLLAARKCPPRAIRLAGGVTRSAVWTQMFADGIGLPVEVVDVQETGTLGCAILGAVAVGEYDTIEEATAHMCKIMDPILPRTEYAKTYRTKYRLYLETLDALAPLWETIDQYQRQRKF